MSLLQRRDGRQTPRIVAAGVLAVGAVAAAASAPAGTGLTAPAAAASLQTWSGRATSVVDGDTAKIDIVGDGKGPVNVRNAGIQAMEVTPRMECHAAEATKRMVALVNKRTVRLRAEHASSTSLGRPVRFVDVKDPKTGAWTDVQRILLQEGHVMWLNNLASEDSRSKEYRELAERAAATGKNLWDPDYCGSGPQQSVPIKIWVNYDAEGDDAANVNGEYVRVLNNGSVTLDLSGWWVRDATHWPVLVFPKGTSVAAGRVLTVRAGKGKATSGTFYWGHTEPAFSNPSGSAPWGDSAYLFDPQGDMRAHALYPCSYHCTVPGGGEVRIARVQYDAPGDDTSYASFATGEYIDIDTGDASGDVDLSSTVLTVNGNVFELARGSVVHPGETLRVYAGKGTASRLRQYWGRDSVPLLPNGGQSVTLRTTEGVTIDCQAWGTGSCSAPL